MEIIDNLDSNVIWIKLLLKNNFLITSPTKQIPQIMSGLPAYSLIDMLDLSLLPFRFFGIYWGYVFNIILRSIFAYIGMYLLLTNHFAKARTPKIFIVLASLFFALLPFWSYSYFAAFLPLLSYAFFNVRINKASWIDWVIIGIAPFLVSLLLTGMFLIALLGLLYLYDILKTKRINKRFLLALFLFSIISLVSHYYIVYAFFSGEKFHRIEMKNEYISLSEAINNTIMMLKGLQMHSISVSFYIFLGGSIAFLMFLVQKRKLHKGLFVSLIYVLFTSFLFGFKHYGLIKELLETLFSFIPIQLDRFYVLNTMVWYLILFFSLEVFYFSIKKYSRWLGIFIVILFVLNQFRVLLAFHNPYRLHNLKPSFREFYAENTFKQIKNIVGNHRTISIGLHPAIPLYSDIYTLDGYVPLYPLKYKHSFRKIIEKELAKNLKIRKYFDNWGSRCYVFIDELNTNEINTLEKPLEQEIKNMELNFKQIKKMKGKYLISLCKISNVKGLKLIEKFPDKYWKHIFLYEIQ